MNLNKLRLFALSQTLFEPTSISLATKKLKFIQADPIRSPARAQDLILRHRVKNYKLHDLQNNFSKLSLEEDYLYAYGFLTRDLSRLLHPKKVGELSKFDKKVLKELENLKRASSKDLEKTLGKSTVDNWWGRKSRATKHSLDILNYYGLVRVVKREKGNKVYETRILPDSTKSERERVREIILAIVAILNPVTEKKLTEALHFTRRLVGDTKKELNYLINEGVLLKQKVDGINYIIEPHTTPSVSLQGVKLLAPFDPLVWDRNRFEHLWGWQYRFEAYTPKEKRVRGYYAMPMLWEDKIIGWANLKVVDDKLATDYGFINGQPKDKKFKQELSDEVEKMKNFLNL